MVSVRKRILGALARPFQSVLESLTNKTVEKVYCSCKEASDESNKVGDGFLAHSLDSLPHWVLADKEVGRVLWMHHDLFDNAFGADALRSFH